MITKVLAPLRKHKHVIIRSYVSNPPNSEEILKEWCRDVISRVGMRVLDGPHAVYSADVPGNEGFTATAVLDFSHLALHAWDVNGLIELDLFSCKEFDPAILLEKLNEFGIISYSTLILDRDDFDQQQIPYLMKEAA